MQRCSDCGGPLLDGDLPAVRPREDEDETVEAAVVDLAAIDSLVAEMPGEEAEHFAEALKMEGVHSRLECGDVVRYRGPGQKATGLISLSKPVRVFVAQPELEAAHDILVSISQEDLVGDAWAAGADAVEIEDVDAADDAIETIAPPLEPSAAGTNSRSLIALLLAIAFGLVFLFVLGRQ